LVWTSFVNSFIKCNHHSAKQRLRVSRSQNGWKHKSFRHDVLFGPSDPFYSIPFHSIPFRYNQ
jgi:hypothetical protein